MVIFEGGNTRGFTGTIIIAIQNTLTKSLASLCKTSFLVIGIRVVLENHKFTNKLIISTYIAKTYWVSATFAAINAISMTWTSLKLKYR